MTILSLTYAPHPIFKQKASPVTEVNADIRKLVDDMFDTLYFEQAVGIGANMVGVLKRVAVVDIMPDGKRDPLCLINPEILSASKETQIFEEASLCFPGISAEIERPRAITVQYLDYEGTLKQREVEGFLATVIQHEMDYLEGRVFLDYLSKMKRDMLLKKMQKHMKMYPPHVHGAGCNH